MTKHEKELGRLAEMAAELSLSLSMAVGLMGIDRDLQAECAAAKGGLGDLMKAKHENCRLAFELELAVVIIEDSITPCYKCGGGPGDHPDDCPIGAWLRRNDDRTSTIDDNQPKETP